MRPEGYSREEVQEHTRKRVIGMWQSGIKWAELLGCGRALDECDAIRATQGTTFPIDAVPELPLPECDKEFCKCIVLAREGPRIEAKCPQCGAGGYVRLGKKLQKAGARLECPECKTLFEPPRKQ